MSEPLYQHLTAVNSEDYRDRGFISRAPLLELSKTLSYLIGAMHALLAVFSFLCPFFRAGVVASFRFHMYIFYICLINHSAVSKPHLTEGAEIYARCGFPGSCKVCCAVRTPVCSGRCATCLCCSLFFCFVALFFPTIHDIVFEK